MSYKWGSKEMNEMNGRKLVYVKFKLSNFWFSFVVFLIFCNADKFTPSLGLNPNY